MEKLSVEELEELREKELDERAERDERIKNTISLLRKHAFVLAVIVAALMLFHGKTELDAAGFIRADENDKRAPA